MQWLNLHFRDFLALKKFKIYENESKRKKNQNGKSWELNISEWDLNLINKLLISRLFFFLGSASALYLFDSSYHKFLFSFFISQSSPLRTRRSVRLLPFCLRVAAAAPMELGLSLGDAPKPFRFVDKQPQPPPPQRGLSHPDLGFCVDLSIGRPVAGEKEDDEEKPNQREDESDGNEDPPIQLDLLPHNPVPRNLTNPYQGFPWPSSENGKILESSKP